jgi:hypothetical protein
VPFISDRDLDNALEEAGVDGAAAEAIVDENADARINGLRAALSVLGIMALAALCFSYGIPTRQPGAQARSPAGEKPSVTAPRTAAST